MPPFRRPEVPPGALRDLINELHALHERTGWISCRKIAASTACSYATVHSIFTKPKIPPINVLLEVVDALCRKERNGNDPDATVNRFDHLWRVAQEEQRGSLPKIGVRQHEISQPSGFMSSRLMPGALDKPYGEILEFEMSPDLPSVRELVNLLELTNRSEAEKVRDVAALKSVTPNPRSELFVDLRDFLRSSKVLGSPEQRIETAMAAYSAMEPYLQLFTSRSSPGRRLRGMTTPPQSQDDARLSDNPDMRPVARTANLPAPIRNHSIETRIIACEADEAGWNPETIYLVIIGDDRRYMHTIDEALKNWISVCLLSTSAKLASETIQLIKQREERALFSGLSAEASDFFALPLMQLSAYMESM